MNHNKNKRIQLNNKESNKNKSDMDKFVHDLELKSPICCNNQHMAIVFMGAGHSLPLYYTCLVCSQIAPIK